MQGLMMSGALTIPLILDHAARNFADQQVVSVEPDGSRTAASYSDIAGSARQLAGALHKLGGKSGDRFATLAWNTRATSGNLLRRAGYGRHCAHVEPPRCPGHARLHG